MNHIVFYGFHFPHYERNLYVHMLTCTGTEVSVAVPTRRQVDYWHFQPFIFPQPSGVPSTFKSKQPPVPERIFLVMDSADLHPKIGFDLEIIKG